MKNQITIVLILFPFFIISNNSFGQRSKIKYEIFKGSVIPSTEVMNLVSLAVKDVNAFIKEMDTCCDFRANENLDGKFQFAKQIGDGVFVISKGEFQYQLSYNSPTSTGNLLLNLEKELKPYFSSIDNRTGGGVIYYIPTETFEVEYILVRNKDEEMLTVSIVEKH